MSKSAFPLIQPRNLALVGLLLVLAPVRAEEPPRATAEYISIEPQIDGSLDDAAWGTAKVINAPAGETRFLWNERGVYVAFRGVEKTPVMGHAKEGESLHEEDAFELFLDQRGDHRQYYEVQIDPAGRVFVKTHILTADPRLTEEGRFTPEFGASELWRYVIPAPEGFLSASQLNRETGQWTAEMFLPASFVNRRDDGAPLTPRTWRIHLVRNNWDLPKGEEGRKLVSTSWAPVLEKHAHISPTRMGYLELKARD